MTMRVMQVNASGQRTGERGTQHENDASSLDLWAALLLTPGSGMARKLRIQYPGAIYHTMNRGDRREPIFVDDNDS